MTFRELCQSLGLFALIGGFAVALVAIGDSTGKGGWYWAALFPGTVAILYAGGIMADMIVTEYKRYWR